MKVRLFFPLSIATAVLALGALATACGGGGGDGGEARALLDLTPGNASDFAYNDLEALRAFPDLGDLLEDTEDDLEDLTDQFDIDLEAVDVAAFISMDGDPNLIIRGDLDRDDLIDALEDEDFDEDDVNGVTVWEGSGHYEAVAFLGGERYAFGYYPEYIEDIVDASKGERRSLADEDDVAGVFDRIAGDAGILGLFVSDDCTVSGCRAWGAALRRVESGTIGGYSVFMFRSEDHADNAQEDVEDELSFILDDARNVEFQQDGNFVEVRFEIDVQDLVDGASEEETPRPVTTPPPTPISTPTPMASPTPEGVEPTLKEYLRKLEALRQAVRQDTELLAEEFAEAFSSASTPEEEIDAAWDLVNGLNAALDDMIQGLNGIDPPAEAKGPHNELKDAWADFREIVKESADGLAGLRLSESELEAWAIRYYAGEAIDEADAREVDACLALQGIADDNGIDVDLECED